jgi:hypothetical protein
MMYVLNIPFSLYKLYKPLTPLSFVYTVNPNEQVRENVTLQTYNTGSNLCSVTDYPIVFRGSTDSLKTNTTIAHRQHNDRLLPCPTPFINHPSIRRYIT